MDFGSIFAILKAVTPLVATVASLAAAVAHAVIVAQHKKDHALLIDTIAGYAVKGNAAINPAPQSTTIDATQAP